MSDEYYARKRRAANVRHAIFTAIGIALLVLAAFVIARAWITGEGANQCPPGAYNTHGEPEPDQCP